MANKTIIEYQGQTKPLIEWAADIGVKPITLRYRICNLKWSLDEAIGGKPRPAIKGKYWPRKTPRIPPEQRGGRYLVGHAWNAPRISALYRAWLGMKNRCCNPKSPDYSNWGGRDICVCDEWMKSFDAFYNDMADSHQKGLSLDRVDNNKGYSKENCRWATKIEQCNNTRSNVILEFQNKKMTIAQWSRELGIKAQTIRDRYLRYNWSAGEALGLVNRVRG